MSDSLRDLDRVEDRIRQHRQVEKAPILVVEGPDDMVVLRPHLQDVTFFPADGKSNVISAMASLKTWNVPGVRAVVDADFDEELDENLRDVVMTYECRDLEAMLISFGALERLLEHIGSSSKLRAAGGAASAAAEIVASVAPVTQMRSTSMVSGFGLCFDDVDFTSKTDKSTLRVDVRRYATSLIAASDTEATLEQVLAAHEAVEDDGRGPRGKDVAALAGLALRSKFGSLAHGAVSGDLMASQIRATAGLALEQSDWLSLLRAWLGGALVEVEQVAA